MLRLGRVVLGKLPHVIVGFTDQVQPADIQKVKAAGVQLAELRIDQYKSTNSGYVLKSIDDYKSLATVATIRSQAEGGSWLGTDQERLALFQAVAPRIDAVDIELSSKSLVQPVVAAAHQAKKLAIVSVHDFKKTPSLPELNVLLTQSKDQGADIFKLATHVSSPNDLRVLAQFLLNHQSDSLIVIGMGPQGLVSRLFFPALGSLLIYAFWGQSLAPGQLGYQQSIDWADRLYFSHKRA